MFFPVELQATGPEDEVIFVDDIFKQPKKQNPIKPSTNLDNTFRRADLEKKVNTDDFFRQ